MAKPPFRTRPEAAAWLLLAVITTGVWGWSIQNGFVFDDHANVLENPWIRNWRLLPEAFADHVAGFSSGYSTSFYRPGMHVLYAVAYAVSGARPWGFHLLNLVAHLTAVLAAYVLVRKVLDRWGDRVRHRHVPLVAGIVFSVHPIHTEPVLWIAGLTDLSYTAFGLLALIAYVGAFRRAVLASMSGVLLLASLLCKETGMVVLPVLLLFEWFEARARSSWEWRPLVARLGPVLAAATIYVVLRLAALGSFAPSAAAHPRGMLELAAAASGLFARYVATLVAPVRLSVMREVHLETSIAQPLALSGLLLALLLAFAAFRYRRSVLIVLAIALAALPILPVLYVPAIENGRSIFGERYLYLPALGIGLAFGGALVELGRRFPWGRLASRACLALFVVWGSSVALVRTRVWADSLSLWTDATAKAPDSAAAHEGLCFALYRANRMPEAMAACEKALAIDPARVDAMINHAAALLSLGRPLEARTELAAALALRPNSTEALVNRGLASMMLGQPDEAMSWYQRALAIDPNYAEAYNVIGVALARAGRRNEAMAYLERAVDLAPDHAEYRDNLRVLRGEGPGK